MDFFTCCSIGAYGHGRYDFMADFMAKTDRSRATVHVEKNENAQHTKRTHAGLYLSKIWTHYGHGRYDFMAENHTKTGRSRATVHVEKKTKCISEN